MTVFCQGINCCLTLLLTPSQCSILYNYLNHSTLHPFFSSSWSYFTFRNLCTLNVISWPWLWMTLSILMSQAWSIIHSSTYYVWCNIFTMDQQHKQNGAPWHRCSWSTLQPKSHPRMLWVCCSTPHTICSIHLFTTHGTERFQIQ